MKKITLLLTTIMLLGLMVFGSFNVGAVTVGQVVINEFLPAPSSGSEWVELYNTSSSNLDIGNCYLDDIAGGGGSPYKIPAGTIIPANGYWTCDFASYFNNTGDDVRFLNTDGSTVLDTHTYGSTGYDMSWYRLPDGGTWQVSATSTPTKGASNGAQSAGSWTPGNLEIHHINVGQSDSTLVVSPTGKSLLIDAGEELWNTSTNAQVIGPYIQGVLGSKYLDYVLITHMHCDHIGYVGYGGLWNLVEAQGFTVGKTIHRNYNQYLGQTSGTFTNWKTYLEGTGKTKLNPVVAVEGTGQIDLGGNVIVNIKAIDGNGALLAGDFSSGVNPPSENDYSIGLNIRLNQFDEWISGDMDGEYYASTYGYAYHDIETGAATKVGDIDIYKVNHHGSDHSSNLTFINQLDPEVSIIAVGDGNTYGHPTQTVIDRLLATSTVYLTERGDTATNVGSAIVGGDIVVKTSDGLTYTVNGTNYTATDPIRTDADGDKYFAEVDLNDNDANIIPQPVGGIDPVYQPGGGGPITPNPPTVTSAVAAKGSVTVNWDTSQTVSFYRLYRSTTSGGSYIVAADNLPDNYYYYKDTGVTAGITYYYVMTSVIGGVESGYSNEVSAKPR